MQEIATIENYAASRFYPGRVVAIKGVPLKLSVTRLHREHINRFTIEPFLSSREFFPPGTMGVEEFTPGRSGEYRMRNVGHGYEGAFIVVDSVEEVRRAISESGVQELSLIHDLGAGRVYPNKIVVQIGIPVRIYNTSLKGNERAWIDPFYTPGEDNVKQGRITTFEFTPDVEGEFAVRYRDGSIVGTLVGSDGNSGHQTFQAASNPA